MATPTKWYVKPPTADDYLPVEGFTSWRNVDLPKPTEPYRNTGWNAGTIDSTAATGIPTSFAAVPAVLNGIAPTAVGSTTVTTLTGAAPDEMIGHAWRQDYILVPHMVFAFNGETIPTLGTHIAIASADTSTEILSTSANHNLSDGDFVSVNTTGTLIGGVTAGTIYTAMVLSATTLKLLSIGGTVVNITSSQSNNYLTLVCPSSLVNGQFAIYEQPCNPCTTLPE